MVGLIGVIFSILGGEHQLTMSLKNAVNVFAQAVQDWFVESDVEGEEKTNHYICLVDKESGEL